jgi:hypothetical protein
MPLGHFYKILVIKCPTHIKGMSICQRVDKEQIQRYDSRLSTLVFVYQLICLSDRIREKTIGKDLARAAKTLLSLGAPDSVRCARLALVKRPLSGIRRRRTAKIHRTVR